MKTKTVFISTIFLWQALVSFSSPAIASKLVFSEAEPGSGQGFVDGQAALKVIGPLHLSEGIVVLKHNQITVLSDKQDQPEEAELAGVLISARSRLNDPAHTIDCLAFFTRGYSYSALDNAQAQESIKTLNGEEYVGRIIDVQPNLLRIKTRERSLIIPARQIAEIKSPRVFGFSLPIAYANSGVASAGKMPGTAASSAPGNSEQIAFRPTYADAAGNNQPTFDSRMLSGQLTEHHRGKRVVTAAVASAAVLACFAIPLSIAVITPRPGSTHATGGGRTSGGQ